MKALTLTVVIPVSDLENAIQYYTKVLGFTFDFIFGDYAGLFTGKANIHLSGPDNQGIKKTPGSALCVIDCDDVDTYYNLLKEKGANISVPIANRVYGVRDFSIDDHDGNTIVFCKAIDD
jgi:predicted enzyme related to lactoylglutathione lyase